MHFSFQIINWVYTKNVNFWGWICNFKTCWKRYFMFHIFKAFTSRKWIFYSEIYAHSDSEGRLYLHMLIVGNCKKKYISTYLPYKFKQVFFFKWNFLPIKKFILFYFFQNKNFEAYLSSCVSSLIKKNVYFNWKMFSWNLLFQFKKIIFWGDWSIHCENCKSVLN